MAVVVTTYDYAGFLPDALDSIVAQTVPASEIIVIDDGSRDDPAAIVRKYPGVRLKRIENGGLANARNVGAQMAQSEFIIFLDADDVLLPEAIAAGIGCMQLNPGAGLVYGGYRLVDAKLQNAEVADIKRIGPRAYHDLLTANMICMHGTVLYDSAKLAEIGGFDPWAERCEDYDVYLRMAKRHRIASHGRIVADYRAHRHNMSAAIGNQLDWAKRVHARHRPPDDDPEARAEWEAGRQFWTRGFAHSVWSSRPGLPPAQRWAQRAEMMGIAPRMTVTSALRGAMIALLPDRAVQALRKIRRMNLSPRLGGVDFGDFANIKPLSAGFGYRRGLPVDRLYIEDFLAANAAAITGRVLEVGDAAYSSRLGRDVSAQDVLNLRSDNPATTIVGDLSQAGVLPAGAYDCQVITQTLHLIYDLEAAVRQLHAALKPGGTVLATVPGISPIDPGEWGATWYWSLTEASARRLFDDVFGAGNVEIAVQGNAFAATSFLQGVSVEDLEEDWLRERDPSYPVVIAIRARKPDGG